MSKNYKLDFPIFKNHPDLIYLDSAATSLSPEGVIEAEARYAKEFGTNALRGLYPLAEQTDAYIHQIRKDVAGFIGALPEEIIFTSGTTHGLNLLAQSLARTLKESGNIVVTNQEHHANFLPWKELALEQGHDFRCARSTQEGFIDADHLLKLINKDTHAVALSAVSNVYGVINNLSPLVAQIRELSPDAFIVIDAAQVAPHLPINVTDINADALVFSGHKMYGPTGVGVLWLSSSAQAKLYPGFVGGGMVLDALATPPVYKENYEKFEVGTLNLSGIFGLGAAIHYIEKIGFENIRSHEQELLRYALLKLTQTFGEKITFLGSTNTAEKIGVLAFTIAGVHPHDIASALGKKNICVRAGEHCASPLHNERGLGATTRLSFGIYTEKSDIDACVEALKEAVTLFEKK